MTHLSDFSFLQRAVSVVYLYVWFLYRVGTLDKFECFKPSRFKQGELKSIVTLLIAIMIPFQLYYDITSCKIKYEEGFASVFGTIITKPEQMWTQADRNLVIPTDYSLCIGMSLQTGTLLLLQCFWNYLANSVAKASFMSSKEFKFYIGWTAVSIVIFPVLQYNFSRDVYPSTYKEIIPELVYACQNLIVALLGISSHFRFQKLLENTRESNNSRSIAHKIRYFQELNTILSLAVFLASVSFIILSVDGLTVRKMLNTHKFSADILICNINISTVLAWFLVILIFHPKPTISNNNMTGINGASHEFLSNPKPGNSNTFENYQAPPHLLTQVSNISSEYDYETKGAVVVPMPSVRQQQQQREEQYQQEQDQEQLSYAGQTYSLPPPPPPPPSGPAPSDPLPQEPTTYYQSTFEQHAPPVFTPSTATLVSSHLPSDMKSTSQSSGASLPRVSESDITTAVTGAGGGERDWSQDWATQQHQHMPLPPPPPPVVSRQQQSFEQASDMDERVGATPPECVRRQRTDGSQWLNQCPRTSTRYS